MTYNVVIPLAGYGTRFKQSGYKNLKPFLKVDGKNSMLDLILNNFPVDVAKKWGADIIIGSDVSGGMLPKETQHQIV